MQSFRSYMQECLDGGESLPAIQGDPTAINFHIPSDRDAVNFALLDATDTEATPEVVYERVRGILGDVGYQLPPVSVLTELFGQESGEEIFPLGVETPLNYLYFAYAYDIDGTVDVLAEVVTESELEELLTESE